MRTVSIGIDQSFTGTGLVVIAAGLVGDSHRHHLVTASDGQTPTEKAEQIGREVGEFIGRVVAEYGRIDVVVMEGYAFDARHQAQNLGELGYCVKRAVKTQTGEWPTILAPSALKKFVTGKGVGKKELLLLNVFKRWGFDTDNNNIADAYGLAQFGRALKGNRFGLLAYQKEVLAAFETPKVAAPKKRRARKLVAA